MTEVEILLRKIFGEEDTPEDSGSLANRPPRTHSINVRR
jgi:hypothetical protein